MEPETEADLTANREFTYRAELKAPVDVGSSPLGTRMFFGFAGGQVEGERIKADVLAEGGDWVLIGTDGLGRVDVRGQWRTDDGAAVFVRYQGLIQMNEAVGAALRTGQPTGFADQYLRIVPQFETGDERYAWLHQHIFVGRGRLTGDAVEFTVFRID